MRQILKPWIVALVVLFLAASQHTMAVSTTGAIRGRVVDEKGEALPGVTVIARSEALVRERATTTDPSGRFEIRDLPPGEYRVVVQMPSYVTMVLDTTVELDATTDLPVSMQSGEISEQITVTAVKPVIDTISAEVSPSFEPEVTNELPVLRQFQSLLTMAPGVTDPDNDGNPNIAGGTGNSNAYIIDGVSSTDPVTGTFGSNFNFDAIDAVDVKLVGISAEYGNFQGGVANLVTKSGSNDFTGSLRDEITNPVWEKEFSQNVADKITGEIPGRPPSEKSHDLQATLGGPIVRDNAWFFIDYSRPETASTQFLRNPAGGPLQNGTYVRLFQGDFSAGKVTWQVTNNHRVQGVYREDPSNVPICYGREFFGGLCYDTYAVDFQNQGGNLYQVLWAATWSPTIQSEVRVGHFINKFAIVPLSPNPGLPQFIFESPGGLGSGAAAGNGPFIDLATGDSYDAPIFGDVPEDRTRDQLEAKVNWFFTAAGEHSLRVGVDLQEQERIGSSIIAGNALFLGVATGPNAGTDINDRVYYVWYDFAPAGSGGPKTQTTALYVQDDWGINEHLTLGLGVRYDKSDNENDVNEEIVGDSGFAPRLSAIYDVSGEGKYLVKATAARYLANINLTTLSPFIRAAGGQSAYDIYTNSGGAGVPIWDLAASVRPDPDVATFDPNLKPQYLDEFTIGYEHLFTPTFGGYIRLIDREFKDTISQRFSYDYSQLDINGDPIPRKIVFDYNNPDAERTYRAAMLQVEKRLAHNWMLLANYTYSKAEGNVTTESGFDTFNSFPGVSQTTGNRFGLLPWDVTHDAKLFGEYRLPLNSTRHSLGVGGALTWQSGNPFEAQASQLEIVVGGGPDDPNTPADESIPVNPLGSIADPTINPGYVPGVDQTDSTILTFLEPRGSRREPDLWQADLQLNYRFAFSKRMNFETRFTVFNITDEDEIVEGRNLCDAGGGIDAPPNCGLGASVGDLQTPRSYRVNLGITW